MEGELIMRVDTMGLRRRRPREDAGFAQLPRPSRRTIGPRACVVGGARKWDCPMRT